MEFLRPWRSWPLPFRNWFPIKILSCVSLKKSRETKGIGDHSLFYTSRHMLDSRWNGQQETFSGALQDDSVSYMKFIPSGNSSPPPHTSPALLPWKQVRASTTMGVVHSLKMVLREGNKHGVTAWGVGANVLFPVRKCAS